MQRAAFAAMRCACVAERALPAGVAAPPEREREREPPPWRLACDFERFSVHSSLIFSCDARTKANASFWGGFQGPFPPAVTHGPALKYSYRSDRVTRDWSVALRVAASHSRHLVTFGKWIPFFVFVFCTG